MQENKDKVSDNNVRSVKLELYLNVLEITLWLSSAILYFQYKWAIYFEYDSSRKHYSVSEFVNLNSNAILLCVLLIVIPMLSLLIFRTFPISGLRKNIKNIIVYQAITLNSTISMFTNDERKIKPFKLKTSLELIEEQINEARNISEKIYQRSGIYLFVGSLIAIIGVFSFYIFNQNSHQVNILENQISDKVEIINFLQRVSILIFIEFVAFFFLRQYRVLLEEYRYYEAIKRRLQDNRLIINISENYEKKTETLKIILEKCLFFQDRAKLNQNETTETLELEKITKDDLNIIDKLLETLKEIKK